MSDIAKCDRCGFEAETIATAPGRKDTRVSFSAWKKRCLVAVAAVAPDQCPHWMEAIRHSHERDGGQPNRPASRPAVDRS